MENSSVLGVFCPRRGPQVNHGPVRESTILLQPGNQKRFTKAWFPYDRPDRPDRPNRPRRLKKKMFRRPGRSYGNQDDHMEWQFSSILKKPLIP